MLTLFREGGYSMFIVLAFGFVSLVWAGVYAARGKGRPLGFAYGLMGATVLSILSGICSDLGTTFKTVANLPAGTDLTQLYRITLEGAGESMAPGVMGFSLVSLTALLLAVGHARATADA